jgi:murein DD-endopeptidase MepM/ murein hydrolase activator NlpD
MLRFFPPGTLKMLSVRKARILTDRMAFTDKSQEIRLRFAAFFGKSRKTRMVSASALFLAACAFGAAGVAPMPDNADLQVEAVLQRLPIPPVHEQLAAMQEAQQSYSNEEKIRPGDSLASLMIRLGIDDREAAEFIKSDPVGRKLLQLKAGKLVHAKIDGTGHLQQFSMLLQEGRGDQTARNLVVTRKGTGFEAVEIPAALERRIEMRSGEIRSSLFAATDVAGIPDSVAMQVVEMFSTNIDFRSDLRRGDRFNVVYEVFWQNGEYVQSGRVLAGEFLNNGKVYQSVWYGNDGSSKNGSYYTMEGRSLKKAFLKSPLEFSRISSGFTMRLHPISGKWKAHKGVDFAAATGTPIRAAADGTIDFIGVQGGYGNLVVIKHWNNYSTAYAHMSRFGKGMKRGVKVDQGDVIGYVGSTGWSTGPHLHYEFRVNNQQRDPMSIDVPKAQALAGADLHRFQTVASDMSHRFTLLRAGDEATRIASK